MSLERVNFKALSSSIFDFRFEWFFGFSQHQLFLQPLGNPAVQPTVQPAVQPAVQPVVQPVVPPAVQPAVLQERADLFLTRRPAAMLV